MNKIGFIGMGNMAKALASGFIESGALKKEQIYAYAPNQDKLEKNAEAIGFNPMPCIKELSKECDTLIMACKPYQIEEVLDKIGPLIGGKALISVAAGWDYDKYSEYIDNVRFQFVMPNTPASVSEGVFLFEEKNSLKKDEREELMGIFEHIGMVIELPSAHMGIGGAISGCGPAFVDVMMEAYADAAVKYGIKREAAYKMVAKTVLGAAKLQLETQKHPGVLKDEVCSPGGTTIRGVAALEEKGFRAACISSIDAVMNK